MARGVTSTQRPSTPRHESDQGEQEDRREVGSFSRPTSEDASANLVRDAQAASLEHGCSVGEYVRRRRLEYVRRKLVDLELPLAQIAIDAGFADQSHLTRIFKRFTGMTPGRYRTFLRFKTG